MTMIKKILLYVLTGCVASMFLFHFTFSFLPIANTKNLMGAVGAVLVFINMVRKRDSDIPRNLLPLFFLAALVSVAGLASTVYNHTSDMAYATYIVSAAIWMCGAYVVVLVMKSVHGKVTFPIITNYLVAVCVFQCIMALLIEYVPSVQLFVDTWVQQGQAFLHDTKRLYGIGASLDTAGCRFSAVLVMLFAVIRHDKSEGWRTRQWLYLISFAIVTVIGNMIARTTLVGVGFGICYMIFSSDIWRMRFSREGSSIFGKMLLILVVVVPVVVFFYNTDAGFHKLVRFGFEGFFNLFEHGEWESRSTNTLSTMVVFPETFKTWIIGDGYFSSPNSDVNYLGDLSIEGFYMGTDIGYLRFLFYFGLIGLIFFIAFFIKAALTAADLFEEYRVPIIIVLLVGFTIWLKVATDLFLFFALLICAGNLRERSDTDNADTISRQ